MNLDERLSFIHANDCLCDDALKCEKYQELGRLFRNSHPKNYFFIHRDKHNRRCSLFNQ